VVATLVAGLALVGCGNGDDENGTTDTETTTTFGRDGAARVYFVRSSQVWPVARVAGDILETPSVLVESPLPSSRLRAGCRSRERRTRSRRPSTTSFSTKIGTSLTRTS
jgi:hypothetical protein